MHAMNAMNMPPVRVPETMDIRLTTQEDELFSLLDECTTRLRETEGIDTACRVAGGWVRDKLLGAASHDIDIALANVMGLAFAERFVAFCAQEKGLPVKAVAKVESNPLQSKHLETAKTTVLGVELDFVNLRSEEYAEGSRIPSAVAFGTPLQDAMRRDITINALFYNVHTRAVEDHTGKGLNDLRSGIIRTPLPPRETFMDDPLRVIRCIRFASRFGFQMVQELQDSARDPVIQHALAQKITRERVGEEIHKMLQGRDPLGSIGLINDLALYPFIFTVPPHVSATISGQPAPYTTSLAAASLLHTVLNVSSSPSPLHSLPPLHPLIPIESIRADSSTTGRLFLAAALSPYAGLTFVDAKKKVQPVAEAVLREGLKLGSQCHYADGIPPLFAAAAVLRGADDAPDARKDRVEIGLQLREKCVHNPLAGTHWTTSILFAAVQELVPLWDLDTGVFDVDGGSAVIQRYNAYLRRIEELGLQGAPDARPLLDGREVVQALVAPKPGPWTGAVLARVVEWQLRHPEGTKDECVAWLRAEQAAGRVDMGAASATTAAKRSKGGEGAAKKAKRE